MWEMFYWVRVKTKKWLSFFFSISSQDASPLCLVCVHHRPELVCANRPAPWFVPRNAGCRPNACQAQRYQLRRSTSLLSEGQEVQGTQRDVTNVKRWNSEKVIAKLTFDLGRRPSRNRRSGGASAAPGPTRSRSSLSPSCPTRYPYPARWTSTWRRPSTRTWCRPWSWNFRWSTTWACFGPRSRAGATLGRASTTTCVSLSGVRRKSRVLPVSTRAMCLAVVPSQRWVPSQPTHIWRCHKALLECNRRVPLGHSSCVLELEPTGSEHRPLLRIWIDLSSFEVTVNKSRSVIQSTKLGVVD